MKNLFLLIFVSLSFQVFGQKAIKEYVAGNTNVIKTIEPDSLDFSDLEVIGKAIGDSKVVMLGEQDHGDAPTFLAKTRLIKYLHEKKGFNVLAFESDFYALNNGWDSLKKDKDLIGSFLKKNIFSVWTACKQCENLFYSYIPNSTASNKPLIITGFDNQVHGNHSNKNIKKFVDDYLQSSRIPFTKEGAYEKNFLFYIDSVMRGNNLEKYIAFENAVRQILFELPQKDSLTFEMRVIKNLLTGGRIGVSRLSKTGDYLAMRDKQMAENLKWIVQHKYPNEKIMVWAHNGHILKNPDQIKEKIALKNPMGNVFTEDLSLDKSTYIIGFDSRTGTAGRINIDKKFDVQNPPKDSFENWIPESTEFAFVDFKRFRIENPTETGHFKLKGIAHSETTAVWTNVFDGIFYIRDMYPCDIIK